MGRFSLLLIFFTSTLVGCAQEKLSRKDTEIRQPMGDSEVKILVSEYGNNRQRVFVHLHSDEKDALTSTLPLLQSEGGVLIQIQNGGKRRIEFSINGLKYDVDPNRIFTHQGVQETLIASGRISNAAMEAADSLGQRIISLVPSEMRYVVALHNNTEGRLSIRSYEGDGDLAGDAAKVNSHEDADPDNFFLTTDENVYINVENHFNAVLQDNMRVRDDGSLSVYYGKMGVLYVNCETQFGHRAEHQRMVRAAVKALDRLTK